MNCPHCHAFANHHVVETRRHEGDVYRRRRCTTCSKAFVTVETAPAELTMPIEAYSGYRRKKARGVAVKKSTPFAANAGVDLQRAWG